MISATLIKFDEILHNGRIYSKEVFERAIKKGNYIPVVPELVSRADFYSKRAMYYAERKKRHCA